MIITKYNRLHIQSHIQLIHNIILTALLVLLIVVGMFTSVAYAAHTVIATVNVGDGPFGVAINAATNRIYVANDFSRTVSVIDGFTNTLIDTINVGGSPSGIAVNTDTNRIYVTHDGGGNYLSVIDGLTNRVIDTVTVGDNPQGIAVNALSNRIYVANWGGKSLSVIDGNTDRVLDNVLLETQPQNVAVNSVTNRIYVTILSNSTVAVIDGITNTVIDTIAINDVSEVAIDTTTNRVYISNSQNSTVVVINGTTNTQIDTINDGSNHVAGIAVNPLARRVYLTDGFGSLFIIDSDTKSVVQRIGVGNTPYSVEVNSVTNRIYVANIGDDTLSIVADISADNTPTPTNLPTHVIAAVNVEQRPVDVAVNPITNRIYVTNSVSNTVSVIDGFTNSVIDTVTMGGGPFDVAVNSVTNRIYVTNKYSATLSVIDGLTNTVVTNVKVGDSPLQWNEPLSVAINTATNRIYVLNSGICIVYVIDGTTNTIVDTIAVSYLYDVAVNPITNRIYITSDNIHLAGGGKPRLAVIDGDSDTVSASIPVIHQAIGVAVDTMTNRIYITSNSDPVSVIDGNTNTVINTINIGVRRYIFGVAVNPIRHHIYLTDYISDQLVIVNSSTNSVMESVNVGHSPQGVAVNPTTNRIYVANRGSNTVSVIADIEIDLTPTPTSPPSLKVQYQAGDTSPNVRLIRSFFKIANTGNTSVPLSELTVRYWYTADTDDPQLHCCIYAGFGCGNMTRRFVRLLTPRQNADYYIEFGFTSDAGSVRPRATTGAIVNWFFKWPFTSYTQTNDYSFDPTFTTYNDYPRMTLYRNGVLIWGVEPPILSTSTILAATSTHTAILVPTNTPTRP